MPYIEKFGYMIIHEVHQLLVGAKLSGFKQYVNNCQISLTRKNKLQSCLFEMMVICVIYETIRSVYNKLKLYRRYVSFFFKWTGEKNEKNINGSINRPSSLLFVFYLSLMALQLAITISSFNHLPRRIQGK